MGSYHFLVQQLSGYFEGCEFRHVPRAQNEAADTLSKLGSSRDSISPGISLEHLRKPSIKPSPESSSIYVPPSPKDVVLMEIDARARSDNPGTDLSVLGTGLTYAVSAVFRSRNKGKGKMYQEFVPVYPGTAPAYPGTDPSVPGTSQPMEIDYVLVKMMEIDQAVFTVREVPSWARPIMDFLVGGQVPADETEARRVTRRSKGYTIINKEIYKRSATGVLQRCVEAAEGLEMLREIHQGECGHHASSRALVAKVFRHGFYWPTALQEAEDLVQKCNGCQMYAHQIHQPASALKTIPITWPFGVWGLDMVGAFKPARGKMTHILVMVDKFTKWIEVKPISKCDGHTAVKFLKDIVLRYGVPHSIITDIGSNFAQGPFARFCEEVGIRLDLASVAHPCTNGQVERSNGLVLSGIKPRLIEPLEKTPGC
jgi:transcription antitermination factor NusG